jgi:hypothetical protein
MLSMTDDGFRSCIQVCWGKRMATLDTGYIGIVPGHSVIGDVAVILLGCSLPQVLRKTTSSYWRLVGECYFHGVTDGELMDESHITTAVETLVLE